MIAGRRLPRARSSSLGFTLIELLAVLIIIGLLLATFVPYAMSIRETANRTRCEKNLRDVYDALASYASANGYNYPRVRFDPTRGGAWTAFTGPDDPNPFTGSTSGVRANDVTGSLWLLVREGFISPRAFVCPSGGGSPDPLLDAGGQPTVVKKRGNFRSADHLNYGYASPFSAVADYRLNDTLPARFALVADAAPREIDVRAAGPIRFDAAARQLRYLNSPNHGGIGQSVLYADGSVTFETSPYCGVGRTRGPGVGGKVGDRLDGDNIYTALADRPLVDTQPRHNEPGMMGITIGPAYRYDAMLVPATDFPDGYTSGAAAVAAAAAAAVPSANATIPSSAPAPAATQPTQP